MWLSLLLADLDGALDGAVKGAIIGGIVGALAWVGIQVVRRFQKPPDETGKKP
jgi:hypothetical protein